MQIIFLNRTPLLMAAAMSLVLAACSDFDIDLRSSPGGFSTTDAARHVAPNRPTPDERGVISYANSQVAVARSGDSVASIAQRVGIPAAELARFNALTPDTMLRAGEVLALPGGRAGQPATPGGFARPGDDIAITTLAEGAIARAEAGRPAQDNSGAGDAPLRHRVVRGETAFSIARLYNITPRALAEWNGLDAEMQVREGQVLTIPVATAAAPPAAVAASPAPPGTGSPTPTPPSAAQPMPAPAPPADAARQQAEAERPAPEQLAQQRTEASASRLRMPVEGRIIRAFSPGRFDGIGIAAAAGTPVRAAAAGTVAAITTTESSPSPIVVIQHSDGLLTVYLNLDDLRVSRGDRVSSGQTIATVRAADPSFLHFEVREGYTAVDPMPFLQ